jgi:hypothetical protein
MENISLSIINLRTNKENALATNQVFLNKSPVFQRNYESWDDKLRTRFIETIILGRATNPIWTVLNEEDESEEILDGMHRITTALEYLNGNFSINKNYLMNLDKEKYHKKFFNDLDADDKARIRNYNFIFNKLDSSYRKDSNKLQDMYEILNRSSKTLNDYEFNKVLLKPFYDIIVKHKDTFVKTNFFKIKDVRGSIDSEMIEMIVLSYDLPNCWSSVSTLTENWKKNEIGNSTDEVNKFVSENTKEIDEKLIFMAKLISDFNQRELFSNDLKTYKKFFLYYKFIVSRCCYLINNYASFNRISENIIKKFKSELITENFMKELGCTNRNAQFQKKLVEKIDEFISNELGEEGSIRRFPKKIVLKKLEEQKGICTLCKKQIKEDDKYQADHITPWTVGGKTVIENCQIVHERCHQIKSAS